MLELHPRLMGVATVLDEELSAAQTAFAENNAAIAPMRSAVDPRLVFMYHTEHGRTRRWLVDQDGAVIDTALFHGHA
jgi:hypothetical protein